MNDTVTDGLDVADTHADTVDDATCDKETVGAGDGDVLLDTEADGDGVNGKILRVAWQELAAVVGAYARPRKA